MISNPISQKTTAIPSTSGGSRLWLNGNRENSSTIVPPFTAIHAPMGASANATPSQTCV